MKKVLFLFFAFAMMQVSAQDLSSLTNSVSSSSGSMVENFAKNQVKNLTKKLNLSETQQEKVSVLVVDQLKSDKFKSILSGLVGSSASKLIGSGSSSKQTDQVQSALMGDETFQNGMSSILDEKQNETLQTYISK